MSRRFDFKFLLPFVLFLIVVWSCSKDSTEPSIPSDIWDIGKDGIPKFVEVNYIELTNIYRISKFRSSVGHDYSDAFEHCRSLKHYFEPKSTVDWSTVKIFSPISGQITRVEEEWAGTKIEIQSQTYPAFRFVIFHIKTTTVPKVDDKVVAGQQLGTHIGSQTMSDIAVIVNDPTRQGKMISYFEVITDTIMQKYVDRGTAARADFIISKDLRDAHPLLCNGDTFISTDSLNSWVVLN